MIINDSLSVTCVDGHYLEYKTTVQKALKQEFKELLLGLIFYYKQFNSID